MASQKSELVSEYFRKSDCCRVPEFDGNIYEYFGGADDPARAAHALLASREFEELFRLYVESYKWTNMCMERLLSQMRHACPAHTCEAERIVASGFLQQILGQHTGHDPRAVSRAQLLERGLPLRCAAKKRKFSRACGPFVHWMRKQEAARKTRGEVLNAEAYLAWQQEKVHEWKTHVSRDEKEYELRQAIGEHIDKRFHHGEVDAPLEPPQRVMETVVDSVGNIDTPVAPEHFVAVAKSAIGMQQGEADPGFLRYAKVLRQSQLRGIFTRDTGRVPKAAKFVRQLSCSTAHPGLCASQHGWCLQQVKACAKQTMLLMACKKPGTFVHCRLVGDGSYESSAWFQLSHTRGSGPAMNMFAEASLDVDSLVVSKCDWQSGYNYMMAVSFFGKLWQLAGVGHAVQAVYVADAPQTEGLRMASDYVNLLDTWESCVLHSEVAVYPPNARLATEWQKASYMSREALMSSNSIGVPKLKRAKKAAGVALKAPKVDGAPESNGSDAASDVVPGSDTDADPLPAFAVEPAAVVEGPEGDGVEGIAARAERQIPFGPWTISEIRPRGVHTGWGANCGQHFCSQGLRCKKNIQARRVAGAIVEGGLDEARLLCKQWLLLGAAIPAAQPEGRRGHVLGIGRADIPLRPEADLDREAAAFL